MTRPDTDPPTEDDLNAYADGRLDADREALVRAYLLDHPELAREIESWRANEAALFDTLAGYGFATAADIPERSSSRRWLANWPAIAAALLIAFGLGSGAGYAARGVLMQPGSEAQWLDVAARDVFLTYVREVRHPVEVGAAERDHLVTWLGNRIEKPFTAPSLADLGFELVGGRLLPLGGRPGAMLMYENPQGDRATILLARNAGARDTAFQFSAEDGVNTFRWVDGPIAYAISGFLDRGDLEDISRAVYAHFETI
ncbi:anti-sigma factor [Pelagibacterium sp. H642]|uniref:anti-sigma factor family protein n=1 Tax=Pelagibacterium sp. H642 TaxID=1881069 RepID=UPI0028156A43|nr:anti-sigma factor [Pelagibacterium sp. H642]WMT92314.1 anti-sigma factor [Pelagibacterium sp. H642]